MKKNNTASLKSYHILNDSTDKLHKKHQQRLDKMTALALKEAKDQRGLLMLLNQEVDKKSQLLTKKYPLCLEHMTRTACKIGIQTRLKTNRFPLIKQIVKPVPSMAFASLFALSIAVILWFDSQTQQAKPDLVQVNNTAVPPWVNDGNVPLELLENMDFYVWLSQSHYAKNTPQQTSAFLVAAWLHQRGTRQ